MLDDHLDRLKLAWQSYREEKKVEEVAASRQENSVVHK